MDEPTTARLQSAIEEACKTKSALVVYSLSRLARSTKDTIAIGEQLDKAGADLVSLSEKIDTTSAAGKMIFRMLAVMADFEKDQISERTKMATRQRRSTMKSELFVSSRCFLQSKRSFWLGLPRQTILTMCFLM